MTIIELGFFLFNLLIGVLCARFAYPYAGMIGAIVAFPLGFLAPIGFFITIDKVASFFHHRSKIKK